jgi:CheY-like chemotaxis protein
MVDDSLSARLVCGTALRQARPDYILLEAADGTEALRCASETPPDYAIIDMNMPGMDGLELASRLRALFPALPICLLTANVQNATRQQAKEKQLFFFGKPITQTTIDDMLLCLES